MANQHTYGIRWHGALNGQSTPNILTFPIASGYAPNTTFGGGGTSVNLCIGDPVALQNDGTLVLTQQGADVADANSDGAEATFGVIVGFPRAIIRSGVGPNGVYTSGTTYSGGIGSDAAIVAAVIPVAGNIFQIDADAVLGTPTRSGALALVGQTSTIAYSVLTSGVNQPKANPLLSVANLSSGGTDQQQLLIVGLGAVDQDQDYTASGVTFRVMFSNQQLANNTSLPATRWGAIVS